MTYSKSCLQLVSARGSNSRIQSEVKAGWLSPCPAAALGRPSKGSKQLKETQGKLREELRIPSRARGRSGQPKRGPATVSGQ